MHLATEVSSTTNHQQSMDHSVTNSKSAHSSNNSSSNDNNKKNGNSDILTAETLAERTIDSLLAEHPGELVRTGSPHVVSISIYLMNEEGQLC